MNNDYRDRDQQWEDLVRRLGGSEDQARAEPIYEERPHAAPTASDDTEQFVGLPGPRDYSVAEEEVEDFQPPEPKAVSTGNPRTLLSWFGVLGATILWLLAGMSSWQLPWWLMIVSSLSFIAGAISLFFLLPKTGAHRNPLDDDDYGNGAKV